MKNYDLYRSVMEDLEHKLSRAASLSSLASPCGLLFGITDAGDLAHPSHHHPQPVVAREDLHGAAHGDALQADPVHLHQLISHSQSSLSCRHRWNSA